MMKAIISTQVRVPLWNVYALTSSRRLSGIRLRINDPLVAKDEVDQEGNL